MTPEVEILIETDDGTMTIGAKRNKLLHKATGMYIVYIDDDDMVSEDYINFIITAIKYKPDCIGIKGVITTNGLDPKLFIHSMRYKVWDEKDDVYLRSPNHCNPVKRSIALKVGFDDNKSYGEDRDYSKRLFSHLSTEIFVTTPIYGYLFAKLKKEYN
jgi:hypothetical protein